MPRNMRRLIFVLQALCLVAMVALPLAQVAALLSPDAWRGAAFSGIAVSEPGAGRRAALLAVSLVPTAALLWALLSVWRLLACYGRGDIFGPRCSLLIRRAGQALLAFAALRLLTHPVLAVLLTAGNPPGQRAVALSVSHADLGLVLGGGLLLVIGWVMGRAADLAEDNAGFV